MKIAVIFFETAFMACISGCMDVLSLSLIEISLIVFPTLISKDLYNLFYFSNFCFNSLTLQIVLCHCY